MIDRHNPLRAAEPSNVDVETADHADLFPLEDDSAALADELAFLYGRINYERQPEQLRRGELKLATMRRLLEELDNPHDGLAIVHVAGTKGKGSVSAMIAGALTRAGLRTGLYTSPHLETIRQRIAIDGQWIEGLALADVLARLRPIVLDMDRHADRGASINRPSFFEIMTAAALVHFADRHARHVVLETGLGGRLDSTNVCKPSLAVITSISFDHMRQLGDTLAQISAEKAGIIKPGVPVVSGVAEPEPRDVIRRCAERQNAALVEIERQFFYRAARRARNGAGDPKTLVTTWGRLGPNSEYRIEDLPLRMRGAHQAANAAVAAAALHTLGQRGWRLDAPAICQGISNASLPGRVEVVHRRPTIILDVAHNDASVAALVAALTNDIAAWQTARPRILVFAASRDKDHRQLVEPLVGLFDQVVLTRFADNPRATDPYQLAKMFQHQHTERGAAPPQVRVIANPLRAWAEVSRVLADDSLVCITGSAFLIAELRPSIGEWTVNKGRREVLK